MHTADILSSKGYRLGPKVGGGTYASVRVVEREKDGTIMAAKIVDTKKCRNQTYVRNFLPNELAISIGLNHKHIISTHEVIQVEGMVFIIMDYAVRGDLLNQIRQNGCMPEKDGRQIFRGIAQGVKYLHDNKISHRDMKCENILLMKDKSAVICDFGFSKRIIGGMPSYSKSFCGSMAYASPQLLFNTPYDPMMNDIWGLGCVLFVMMCATMPYDDMRLSTMRTNGVMEKVLFPVRVVDKLHQDCKDLIYKMLEIESDQRLFIDGVLSHPWLTDG